MKRKLFSVLLILVLCLSMAVSVFAADGNHVYDEAGLLSKSEASELEGELARLSEAYDAQIVVVTLDSADGRPIEYLVDDVYDGMEFGIGPDRDGVLLLVCMDIREYQIIGNGYPSVAVNNDNIDKICDAIEPDLSDGDYAEAFGKFAERCAYYLDGYRNGFPFRFGESLLLALTIGVVVGLIVAFVLRGQLKSVHRQNRAHSYVRPGSMNVRVSRDIYLYRNVSRIRKESSSSSRSSGGSSRSRGGGSF